MFFFRFLCLCQSNIHDSYANSVPQLEINPHSLRDERRAVWLPGARFTIRRVARWLVALMRRLVLGICLLHSSDDQANRTCWTLSQNCEQRLLASSCLSASPSVCPSAWKNSAVTGRIFMKVGIWVFFLGTVQKSQVTLKSD